MPNLAGAETTSSAPGGTSLDIVAMSGVAFVWSGRHAFSLTISHFILTRRERVLLLGPSGGGKSTFLSLIAGIVTPDEGKLEILGMDTGRLSNAQRDRFRAEHFGIIFQMFTLLPYGSVLDNVVLPLSFAPKRRRRAGGDRSAIEREAQRLLTSLGIEPAELRGLDASSLSVG